MSMTVTTVGRSGAIITNLLVAAADDVFDNTGSEFLVVNNGSGSSITVTIVTTQTVDGIALPDRTVVVAAGKETIIGPFPTGVYNNDDEQVSVTYSSTTTVTACVLKCPSA